jgi:curved DNA-binding protein CbpA
VILGVEESASPEEIRQAYLDAVQLWHPDRFSNDPTMRREAEFITKRINEAHEALCRPKRRRAPRSYRRNHGPAHGLSTGEHTQYDALSPPWDREHSVGRRVIVTCVVALYLLACLILVYAIVAWS